MSDFSLNETASRARLAAKGAGYSWGLADEVYRSVYWLVRHDFPAPAMLVKLLSEIEHIDAVTEAMPIIDSTDYRPRGGFLCPILFGCALTDRISSAGENQTISFTALVCPLLITPFVAEIASEIERVAVVQLGDNCMVTDGQHLRLSSPDIGTVSEPSKGDIHYVRRSEIQFHDTERLITKDRVSIDADVWQSLDKWAHRTYAPATDASRLSGAGAGVLDND